MIILGSKAYSDLPATYDLRDVNGTNLMTSVKNQSGGTCWTFGTMGAMESNLKITGNWIANGESNNPNLAEYHLDWWNGFNQHNNDDTIPKTGGGLQVHQGGDYRVAAAYMTRGDGAVRDSDAQSYSTAPNRSSNTYHYYCPEHIEWFTDNNSLYNISTIKNILIERGALGTCVYYANGFFSAGTYYQPPSDANEPNHAITMAGWDDNKVTQATTNGAWLCKNSWGPGWNGNGYFWISYYDKYCGKHPEMGAVSFKNVKKQSYKNIYYHDYHGWRDTFSSNTALNIFYANDSEKLDAVSFYTATNNVDYLLKIFSSFKNGTLSNELISQTGTFEYTGFHNIELDNKLTLTNTQQFCIFLKLSHGGQAFDRTSEIPVLLYYNNPEPEFDFEKYLKNLGKSKKMATVVVSSANAGQSFYWNGAHWIDFTNINATANFCIKGLTVSIPEPFLFIIYNLLIIIWYRYGKIKF